ncbi:hypothetical protein Pyn_08530 [Prunus yedoensis var. nudiflora]|uniref:Uncharacterized protein n=1 Tax=Prunus yedoensis var. nudiflora TaxID=2094558 RepID=A0A314XJA3_PRUYE|nr:hypothetical protein Pyn_08530 [Prunus yedoensis var. nudiflora]
MVLDDWNKLTYLSRRSSASEAAFLRLLRLSSTPQISASASKAGEANLSKITCKAGDKTMLAAASISSSDKAEMVAKMVRIVGSGNGMDLNKWRISI